MVLTAYDPDPSDPHHIGFLDPDPQKYTDRRILICLLSIYFIGFHHPCFSTKLNNLKNIFQEFIKIHIQQGCMQS